MRLALRPEAIIRRSRPWSGGPYSLRSPWRLYLDARRQTEIEKILSGAAQRMPVARVSLEPHGWSTPARLQFSVCSQTPDPVHTVSSHNYDAVSQTSAGDRCPCGERSRGR
jgi:hypothetical protein